MSGSEHELLDVPVAGGALRVARFGTGPVPVLGIHGVTASWVSLLPVARRLGPEFTLYAPDLRGRGASSGLPGPYGMAAHAADCAAVLEHLELPPLLVTGESMGGFVAVALAAHYPEKVVQLLLVDGGLPMPLPPGIDPAVAAAAALGPALARLHTTYPSREEYRAMWQAHPAFLDAWNEDVAAYVDYDLVGTEPALRSRVSAAAVDADTHDLLGDPAGVAGRLAGLTCPVHLLRAPAGLLAQPEPTIPDAVVQEWLGRLPQLTEETVSGTNHYTLMFGATGAAAVSARIRERALPAAVG